MNTSSEIAKMLLEIQAVSIRSTANLFTWASGIKSPIYCDNRLIMSYPKIRDTIAEEFKKIIMKDFNNVEVIAGTATAGIPHAAWVSQKINLPMVYVRNSAKNHGRQNQIEGKINNGQKVVLIEDLLSTGGSSIKAAKALRDAGAKVLGVIAIFSYNFKSLDELYRKENLKYKVITGYNTLLPIALEEGYIKKEEFDLLKKWSQDPYIFTK